MKTRILNDTVCIRSCMLYNIYGAPIQEQRREVFIACACTVYVRIDMVCKPFSLQLLLVIEDGIRENESNYINEEQIILRSNRRRSGQEEAVGDCLCEFS